jgi:hypothetical protein
VAEILVDDGDTVTRGDVLIWLAPQACSRNWRPSTTSFTS